MSRRPWMQFFPADWRADPSLRLCSRAARGTWIDMLAIMHEAASYGELTVNGTPLDAVGLAKLLGERPEDIAADLAELESNGVFSRRRNGVIYSRRMERDEIKSSKNRDNGKMGGNPSLCRTKEKTQSVNPPVKPHKPEARSQKPEEVIATPPSEVAARENYDRIVESLFEAAGEAVDTTAPSLQAIPDVLGWIEQGCDLDLDVLPAIRAASVKPRHQRVRSWAYFSAPVADWHRRRLAGLPPPTAGPPVEKYRDPTMAACDRVIAKLEAAENERTGTVIDLTDRYHRA